MELLESDSGLAAPHCCQNNIARECSNYRMGNRRRIVSPSVEERRRMH